MKKNIFQKKFNYIKDQAKMYADINSDKSIGIVVNGHKGTYTGQIINNKPSGHGICVFDTGTYTGEWKEGTFNGYGTYLLLDGSKYEGEWKDDQRHGKGILYLVNGSKYEGEWKDDQRHGKGILYLVNGSKYEGEWKDDQRHGKGILYLGKSKKYEGEFMDGKINGKGIYYYDHGFKYEGEFMDGKINGKGIYYYNNGDKYEGEWHDNLNIKITKLILATGEILEVKGDQIIVTFNAQRNPDIRGYQETKYTTGFLTKIYPLKGNEFILNLRDDPEKYDINCNTPDDLLKSINTMQLNTVAMTCIPGHGFIVIKDKNSQVYVFDQDGLLSQDRATYLAALQKIPHVDIKCIDHKDKIEAKLLNNEGIKEKIRLSEGSHTLTLCRHFANYVYNKIANADGTLNEKEFEKLLARLKQVKGRQHIYNITNKKDNNKPKTLNGLKTKNKPNTIESVEEEKIPTSKLLPSGLNVTSRQAQV